MRYRYRHCGQDKEVTSRIADDDLTKYFLFLQNVLFIDLSQ